eukprot:Awhi_evm1s5925
MKVAYLVASILVGLASSLSLETELGCQICHKSLQTTFKYVVKAIEAGPSDQKIEVIEDEFEQRVCPILGLLVDEAKCRAVGQQAALLLENVKEIEGNTKQYEDWVCTTLDLCPKELVDQELIQMINLQVVSQEDEVNSCSVCQSTMFDIVEHAQKITKDEPEKVLDHVDKVCEKLPFVVVKSACHTGVEKVESSATSLKEKLASLPTQVCKSMSMCTSEDVEPRISKCDACLALVEGPLKLALDSTDKLESLCSLVPEFIHDSCEEKAAATLSQAMAAFEKIPRETCTKMKAC